MTPRTGRPASEDSRTERVVIYLNKDDKERAEAARHADKEPERSFATWLAKRVSEMFRKTKK